jgi:CRP-like cAMP-binding protein
LDGSIIPLGFATAGRFLALDPLFGARGADAWAVVRSRVAWVPIADVRHLLLSDVKATFTLAAEVHRLLDESTKRLEMQVGRHALRARIAETLLELSEMEAGRPEVIVSHEMLAFATGSRREVVTRMLGSLSAGGLIALARGRIRLLDEDGLRALCDVHSR